MPAVTGNLLGVPELAPPANNAAANNAAANNAPANNIPPLEKIKVAKSKAEHHSEAARRSAEQAAKAAKDVSKILNQYTKKPWFGKKKGGSRKTRKSKKSRKTRKSKKSRKSRRV